MKARIKAKTPTLFDPPEDQARARNLKDLQAEFTRLTHAVDEAKRHGSTAQIAMVGVILSLAYQLIDSWGERGNADLRK